MTDHKLLKYIDDPDRPIMDKPIMDKPKKSLRIMTYNVHGFMDRKNQKKIDQIFGHIKDVDPDILVLEEIYLFSQDDMPENELVERLKSFGLKFYSFSGKGLNGVFSKYAFTAKPINLISDPIRHISRSAIVCDFQKFPDFALVGTHLDVFDKTGATRVNQMNNILKELQINYDGKTRAIITGDLNSLRKADYSDEEWRSIVTHDRTRNVETIEDVVPILEKNNYIDSFVATHAPIKVSVWANRRVDYIYGKNIEFLQSDVVKSTASDHYPVYCDIKI